VRPARGEPPDAADSPALSGTRIQLAEAIDLRPDQVRIQASNVVQSDTFVFRVAELADWTDASEQAVQDAQAAAEEARRAHEDATERLEAARDRIHDLEHDREQMDARQHAIEIRPR
jgi:hypothetical protein